MTTATASPVKRTRSTARHHWSSGFLTTIRNGVVILRMSSPVKTATTPGWALATSVSMETISADAWGERKTAA